MRRLNGYKVIEIWWLSMSIVMSVCLFALMIVLLIYCVLSIFVVLINIILVMYNVDYY